MKATAEEQSITAVLLQADLVGSTAATARKLAPVYHPALQPASRPAYAAEKQTRNTGSAGSAASCTITDHIDSNNALKHVDPCSQDGAHSAILLCAGRADSSVEGPESHAACPPVLDIRANIVLDRCHAVEGCEAPVPRNIDRLLGETSSRSSIVCQQAANDKLSPAAAALDALASSSASALSSTVAAMKERSRERMRQMLEQQQQQLLTHRYQVQEAMQQLKEQVKVVYSDNGPIRTAKQLQSQQCGIVSGVYHDRPLPCAQQQPGSAGEVESGGSREPAMAVQALSAALQQVQGLRSDLHRSDIAVVKECKSAAAGSVMQRSCSQSLGSRMQQLKAKFAAATEQLQQASMKPMVNSAVASTAGLAFLDEQGSMLVASKGIGLPSAGQARASGLHVAGQDSSNCCVFSSDDDLDADLQQTLHRIFKSSLPLYKGTKCAESAGRATTDRSSAAGIPSALYTSTLPPAFI